MSKIVFFCIPAHGHTNPTLGVVEELVKRGHEVWYYSYTSFKEKIEARGAKFIACDEYDSERKVSEKDATRVGKDMAFSINLLVETTLALDDMVCRQMAELKPDLIVADSMAAWGKAAAMKLGIPFVSSTTTFAFNQHSAKIMKQSPGNLFGMIFAMPKINKDIKRLQDKGYPVTNFLELISNNNDTNTIVYTSPEFQPASETFSDKYSFVGPSIRAACGEIEKTADKLIYISMGTVINDNLKFYKECIKAFGGTEYQVIMSVGKLVNIADLGEIPANITVEPFVDQMAVLEKADLFFSHCGMNSASESLYHRVPLVTFPQTSEQGAVATRAEMLGAGVRLKKVSAEAIRAAAETVLSTPSYRESASALADGFRKCTGAKGAADKIEALCRK